MSDQNSHAHCPTPLPTKLPNIPPENPPDPPHQPPPSLQFVFENPEHYEPDDDDTAGMLIDDSNTGPPPPFFQELVLEPLHLHTSIGLSTAAISSITQLFLLCDLSDMQNNDALAAGSLLAPFQGALSNLIAAWSRSTGSPKTILSPAFAQQQPPPLSTPTPDAPMRTTAARNAAAARQTPGPQPTRPNKRHNATGTPAPGKGKGMSYAAAAALSPLDTVTRLSRAFPEASVSTIANLAKKVGTDARKAPKPAIKVQHAPKGANKTVHVSFSPGQAPRTDRVLPDGENLAELQRKLGDNLKACVTPDGAAFQLRSCVWNARGSFRLEFSHPPPVELDVVVQDKFSSMANDGSASSVRISRFQFTNRIMFRRVPIYNSAGAEATALDITTELFRAHAWENVRLANSCQLFRPEGADFAFLFVEFVDTAAGRTLKELLRHPVLLNGDLCRPERPRSNTPLVPQCPTCQRWGHRAGQCRAPSKVCARCAGPHDERMHALRCKQCTAEPGFDLYDVTSCEHDAECANCHTNHRSDSRECPFFLHRKDAKWIREHQGNPARQGLVGAIQGRSRQTGPAPPSRVNRPTRSATAVRYVPGGTGPAPSGTQGNA